MPQTFYALAVLACPVGMGLMMWLMMRGNRPTDQQRGLEAGPSATDAELARLRAELDQLRAEQRDHPRDQQRDQQRDQESRSRADRTS